MRRKRSQHQFTPFELEIMKVLWTVGGATVQEVRDRLDSRPKAAYTTVQTMLNVLHRKRSVKRILKGKAYEYVPCVSREGAFSLALGDMLHRLFGGSAEALVMTLVKDHHLSPEQFARLQQLVAEGRTNTKKPDTSEKDGQHATD